MKTIPEFIEFLKANDACEESLEWLSSFSDPLTALESCEDSDWLAQLCKIAGIDVSVSKSKYASVERPARAQYKSVESPARAWYESVVGPTWAKYEPVAGPARARYESVEIPARVQYESVEIPAREQYVKEMKTKIAERFSLAR
jgi:hypothetical protein